MFTIKATLLRKTAIALGLMKDDPSTQWKLSKTGPPQRVTLVDITLDNSLEQDVKLKVLSNAIGVKADTDADTRDEAHREVSLFAQAIELKGKLKVWKYADGREGCSIFNTREQTTPDQYAQMRADLAAIKS